MEDIVPYYAEKKLQTQTIELFKAMGYQYLTPEEALKARGGQGKVLLTDILATQLQKMNGFTYKSHDYLFSNKNISQAIQDLNISLNEGLMTANEKITDMLVLGSSYDEELLDGAKKSFNIHFIDFDNPQNNIFHITEEFSVLRNTTTENLKTRRPDLVLFINGIPFGVIELKKSSVSTKEGIKQMVRNQQKKEIPELFKYIQITLAGNNSDPQYGTTGTPSKFYSIWTEQLELANMQTLVTGRMPSKLDEMVYGLFSIHRVPSIIRNFILFDNKVKKIARYQQYFGIVATMYRIKSYKDGTRQGGLLWHTQGSGKSLTMVMLTKFLLQEIPGAQIIVVTDRTNLDEQIHTTFMNTELKAHRASSGSNLISLLQDKKQVITTLVHKFRAVFREKIVLPSSNIFVLVDESHRGHGGELHQEMRQTFTNGCYIGFTGTPLLKKDKKNGSTDVFGKFIHTYSMTQAMKDGSVLPLFYEGRLADQWIHNEKGMDQHFEILSKHLNDEQKKDLKKKYAKFKTVASSEQRLFQIALDINQHFKTNFQGTGKKAMLATSSKLEAIRYQQLFTQFGDMRTQVIISPPDQVEDDGKVDAVEGNKAFIDKVWHDLIKKFKSAEDYENYHKKEFVEGDKVELLIVVDKLLTGFDAPCACVLYLDKDVKEHNLLQAIARVNRLADGKDFGLIIDYRGLLGNLQQAIEKYEVLSGFDGEDISGSVFDIKEEIAKVKTYYSHLHDLFFLVQNKEDMEELAVFLADDPETNPPDKRRKSFYDLLSTFARALTLCLGSQLFAQVCSEQDIAKYKVALKKYAELRKTVRLRYHEAIDFGEYEAQMQKLLDTYISCNEVNQLTNLVSIFDDAFQDEVDRLKGDNARADMIISATNKTIREKREQNPAFYQKLSERIKDILDKYKNGRLSDEEKLKNAHIIRQMLLGEIKDAQEQYPPKIQSNRTLHAFWDNLEPKLAVAEEELEYVILSVHELFLDAKKTPDWKTSINIKKHLDQEVDDLFWRLEEKTGQTFSNIDELIEVIRSIGINNYE